MKTEEIKEYISNQYKNYSDYFDRILRFYDSLSKRFHYFYNINRISLIVASAAAPLAAYLSDEKELTVILTTFVAILVGLDSFFKPGEQWRNFRNTQLTLEYLKHKTDKIFNKINILEFKSEELELLVIEFDSLRDEVERVMQEERTNFWNSRIQAMQSPKN